MPTSTGRVLLRSKARAMPCRGEPGDSGGVRDARTPFILDVSSLDL